MDTFKFSLYRTKEITNVIAEEAVGLLKKQGKVNGINAERIKRCKKIVLCYNNEVAVAIGAIKKRTDSDFSTKKANLSLKEDEFKWELGYFFTEDNFRSIGIAHFISKILLKEEEKENLFASTELFPKNNMMKILQENGFIQVGNPWRSGIHDGHLGLFIKFKKGEKQKKAVLVLPQ